MSVCTALLNSEAHNGSRVTIRGVLNSTDEGAWLVDESCTSDARTVWPMRIWLEMRRGDRTDEEFAKLVRNAAKISEELRAKRYDPSRDRVLLTVTGRFSAIDRNAGSSRTVLTNGFGHMNAAPAEILVESESDLSVERVGSRSAKRPVK